jgi:hypothetical protein
MPNASAVVSRRYRQVEEIKIPDGVEYRWNGLLHNNGDLPAIKTPTLIAWYKEGKLHRAKGPALKSTTKISYYRNGVLHRTDGPAVKLPDGTKKWYNNGKLHNTKGPAIVRPSGIEKWFIHGNFVAMRAVRNGIVFNFDD